MPRNIQRIQITDTNLILAYDDGTGEMRNFVQAAPVSPPPPPPVVTPSSIIRGGYFDGVPDASAGGYADQFGMTVVRSWFTIQDWNKPPVAADFARQRTLQAQGLKNLVVFTPPEKTGAPPATPAIAAAWFKGALLASAAIGGAVDYWEIWNEPNLANYNTSYAATSSLWIKNALIPAYAVLHAAGQYVISGGWSEDLSGIPWMISNGLLTNCDAVGYHPYGSTSAQHIQRVQQMRNLVGSKPLWLTEWNVHEAGNVAWPDDLIACAQGIKSLVQAVIHFRMVRTTQAAGGAAPFWNDGGTLLPAADFHDKLVTAMGDLS